MRIRNVYKNLNLNGVNCTLQQDLNLPTYSNRYSLAPHYTDCDNDEFICVASFKPSILDLYLQNSLNSEEQKNGFPRRVARNMLVKLLVYESDNLSLKDQLKKADKIINENNNIISSITFSGSKSAHLLVRIPDKYSELVHNDIKYWWKKIGLKIFTTLNDLDEACATNTRLTRNPNGLRDGNIKQVCYYYNKNASMNEDFFEFWTPYRKKELRDIELENIKRKNLIKANREETIDDLERKLANMYSKPHSNAFEVAYLAYNGVCPKGANYIAAYNSFKTRGLSKLIPQMLENVVQEHPTNISRQRAQELLGALEV